MSKKLIALVLCITLLIILLVFVVKPSVPSLPSRKDNCKADCKELGKEYFKFQNDFGGYECWCLKENNETTQIW